MVSICTFRPSTLTQEEFERMKKQQAWAAAKAHDLATEARAHEAKRTNFHE